MLPAQLWPHHSAALSTLEGLYGKRPIPTSLLADARGEDALAVQARMESFVGLYTFLLQTTISGKTELLLQSDVQRYTIGSATSSGAVWRSMIMDATTVRNMDLFVNRQLFRLMRLIVNSRPLESVLSC